MKRIALNFWMIVFFLLIMSFQFLPKILHELLGFVFLVAVFLHILWNRQWLRTLPQGKWTMLRSTSLLINVLLGLTLAVVLLTGIDISNYLFKDMIPLALQRNIMIHQLHVSGPYLLLILMGFHLGLHGQGLWQRVVQTIHWNRNTRAYRINCYSFMLLIFLGGTYGSFLNRIGDRLQLKHIFATEATQASWGLFLLLLLSVMGMYAVIAYIIRQVMK